MSKYIVKNTDSHLVVKIVSENNTSIDFSDGTKSGVVPVGYYINGLQWSQDPTGNISLIRSDGVSDSVVYELFESSSFNFYGKSDNEHSDRYVKVSSSSVGHKYTLLIELKKIV